MWVWWRSLGKKEPLQTLLRLRPKETPGDFQVKIFEEEDARMGLRWGWYEVVYIEDLDKFYVSKILVVICFWLKK